MGRAPLLVLCHIVIASPFKSQGNIPPVKFHFYLLQTKRSEQTRSHLALSRAHAHTHQQCPGAVSVFFRPDTQFHHSGFDIAFFTELEWDVRPSAGTPDDST